MKKGYIIGFIVLIALMALIVIIFMSYANAQGVGNHKRYEINVRIAKTPDLPTYITNNLVAIQTSIGRIKNVSQKIKGYEDTNSLNIDNTNPSYLEIKASLAIPYPLPQGYIDEQIAYENFLRNISPLCMATGTGFYVKKIQSHVCNNGLVPNQSCSGVINY